MNRRNDVKPVSTFILVPDYCFTADSKNCESLNVTEFAVKSNSPEVLQRPKFILIFKACPERNLVPNKYC